MRPTGSDWSSSASAASAAHNGEAMLVPPMGCQPPGNPQLQYTA